MHLLMILMALAIALGLRQGNLNRQSVQTPSLANLDQRWRSGIIALVAPVLLSCSLPPSQCSPWAHRGKWYGRELD